MKDRDQTPSTARRRFLRGAVTAGASAAVVTAVPGTVAAADAAPADAPAQDGKESQGYHVTQHVIDYYKSARV